MGFSWRTGPWASDPHSGNSLLLYHHDSLPCCISPWCVCRNWRGIRVPPSSLLSPGPRICLFLYASCPPHLLSLVDLDPAGDVPSQAVLSASGRRPRSSSPGLLYRLSAQDGQSVTVEESLNLSKPPLLPNIFMQFLWGRFEVEKKSPGGSIWGGTSLLALPVLVAEMGIYDLIIWAFGFLFSVLSINFKPLPGHCSAVQYSHKRHALPTSPHAPPLWGLRSIIIYYMY